MKLLIDLTLTYFSVSIVLVEFIGVVCSSQTFLYEKMHNFGRGNRVIPNYRRVNRFQYPEPLPSSTLSPDALHSPFHNLYQGVRKPNDTRVYRRKFAYSAQPTGQQVVCEGLFDCIITHIAMETNAGIPTLLRGGVGYRHFLGVARARAGDSLQGSVRAYCLKGDSDYYKDYTTVAPDYYRFMSKIQ